MSVPRRGEVYWVRFDPVEGSEISKTRPAAVISNDIGNRHSARVIVAPISSSTARIYPFEVFVEAGEAGLQDPGKVLLDQIRSIDKARLGARLGALEPTTIQRLNQALHVSLDLRCKPNGLLLLT